MKCTNCGATVHLEREVRAYSNLLSDVIVDGIERGMCPKCGETFTAFPRWDELGKLVAGALIAKPTRLTPGEVRFLRTSIGLKGQDLAGVLGVAAVQVSRWENGAQPISTLADRLLRLVVVTREGLVAPDLRTIDAKRSEPLSLRIELGRKNWRVAHLQAARW